MRIIIPKKIYQANKFKLLKFPDESTLACEEGLYSNNDFQDYRDLTWTDYHIVEEKERKLLLEVEVHTKDHEHFDKLMFEAEDYDPDYLYFDLGINAITYVLNAAGLPTVTACRGHPTSSKQYPWVTFYAHQTDAQNIRNLLNPEIGLEVVHIETTGLLIYAQTHMALLDFSRVLEQYFNKD